VQGALPQVAATAAGERLLRLFEGQPIEGFERSFKMSAGRLLAERWLLGIRRDGADDSRIEALCAGFGMPARALEALRERLGGASNVHFGFEAGPGRAVHKVYLEFSDAYYRAVAAESREALMLHLAFKWRSDGEDDGRFELARYVCHPGLDVAAMLERADACWAGAVPGPSRSAARALVALAARRTSDLMYLDVREEGNPRASFDVNLHAAALRLAEAGNPLRAASDEYGIPRSAFEALWTQARDARLGHVAAGISRHGEDFLTVYYEPRAAA
jgi:hypothetical protein